MLAEYSLLPPHWRQCQDAFGNVYYYNEVTEEESKVHPYEKFLEASKTIQTKNPDSSSPNRPSTNYSETPSEFFQNVLGHNSTDMNHESRNHQVFSPTIMEEYQYFNEENQTTADILQIEHSPSSPSNNQFPPVENSFEDGLVKGGKGVGEDGQKKKGIKYDYHCQWNERDLYGKVTLYGLTIRFTESGDTLLKFDGIDGEWTYTSLKGPYGCLEMCDLYIGAKINVFGRHLTISSANAAACNWIYEETKRLQLQQDQFRKKIELIGEVPCIKKKAVETVRHITRNTKTIGQTNVRQLMKENARLGEQLASLGLAFQL